MALKGETDDPSSSPPSPSRRKFDPILRNALYYTITKEEYKTLTEYLQTRAPQAIQTKTVSLQACDSLLPEGGDYNAAAVRASLRVFLFSNIGLNTWDFIIKRILSKGRRGSKVRTSLLKLPSFRLSLSLSTILLLHRLIHRFFSRLRANLLADDAAPFRWRNPRISRSLTSQLAPSIGASLAGFALGIYPADQLRITIGIYFATKAAEFLYNALERDGWLKRKPWWWGSWMIMPLSTGQLLHAFVYFRNCSPKPYVNFILTHTPNYLQQKRPASYPSSLPWPDKYTIVDGLAEMARLKWPSFISPILFPTASQTLPSTLTQLSPVTSPAHPSHAALSCATLHPADPSCTRTFATYFLSAFPMIAKFLAPIYTLFSILRYRKILKDPIFELDLLVRRILRTAAFLTGAIGTSWGSICLFQSLLPRTFLPHARWFLGGALGGLWVLIDQKGGKAHILYSMRVSIDSFWKVGKEKGWWKGVKGGDVAIFVAGLALMNVMYEKQKGAVDESMGKGLGWMRGEQLFPKKVKEQETEKKTA